MTIASFVRHRVISDWCHIILDKEDYMTGVDILAINLAERSFQVCSAFLLLAQAAIPIPQTVPAPQDEIVVVGQRLGTWRGKVSDTLGIKRCKTTKSTGDAEIDRIGCQVLTDCLTIMKPKIIAVAKSVGRNTEKRRAAMTPVNEELAACFKDRRESLITELVAVRSGRGE
jgi:hypothetical protein